jgi:RNAse (barnase) inhibitor barstar
MALLRDPKCAGLYACDHDLDRWYAAASASGLLTVAIDLENAGTKTAILDAFADALALPEYFGGNWDAMDECLRDDAWHEPRDAARHGMMLRIDGAAFAASRAPEAFETMVELLDDAVEFWRERAIACWVLVASDEPAEFGLEALPDFDAAAG